MSTHWGAGCPYRWATQHCPRRAGAGRCESAVGDAGILGPMAPVLTTRSARVAAARKLALRKHRDHSGLLVAEGPQAVAEAVHTGLAVEVFATQDASARWADLVRRAEDGAAQVYLVTADALDSLAQTRTPQGIVAVCRWVQPQFSGVVATAPQLGVLLHEISDPGNAGTVIRVADAAGASFVALSEGSVDPTNGKCVRASTGSVFHLPVVDAGPTAAAVHLARDAGMRVLAADVDAQAVDLFEAEGAGLLGAVTLWLFGNEAHGLPADVLAMADAVIRIPILGRAESLNLATAAAVCLYASARVQARRT